MVSKVKLYAKLDALETELQELIIPHLKHAANGGNDQIFCVKQFNPLRKLKCKTDQVTEELIEIGSSVLSLREKLGEPFDGTIAERICWYCREWSTTKKHNSSSVITLAKKFLAEIENEET